MMTIKGPYCFVCGGTNVVKQLVWDVSAWTTQGPVYGQVLRDVCLDCERKDAKQENEFLVVSSALYNKNYR